MVTRRDHLLVLPTVPTLLAIAVLHKQEIVAPVRIEEEETVEGGGTFPPLHLGDGTRSTEAEACSHQLPETGIYNADLLDNPEQDFFLWSFKF